MHVLYIICLGYIGLPFTQLTLGPESPHSARPLVVVSHRQDKGLCIVQIAKAQHCVLHVLTHYDQIVLYSEGSCLWNTLTVTPRSTFCRRARWSVISLGTRPSVLVLTDLAPCPVSFHLGSGTKIERARNQPTTQPTTYTRKILIWKLFRCTSCMGVGTECRERTLFLQQSHKRPAVAFQIFRCIAEVQVPTLPWWSFPARSGPTSPSTSSSPDGLDATFVMLPQRRSRPHCQSLGSWLASSL